MALIEETATIAKAAALGLPLALPWIPDGPPIQTGDTFHSRLATSKDPWSKLSPFHWEHLNGITVQYQNDDGGVATFRSTESETNTTSTEHLSVAFGISFGNPFLGASVTGGYDKDTMDNNDSRKTSMTSSFRAGSVVLVKKPRLSTEAMMILKYQGGLPALKTRFGDYYVAGYRLGGDAGVMLSEMKSASKTLEALSVTVTGEILFISASKTWKKFFSGASSSSSFRVHGFDTLTRSRIPPEAPVKLDSTMVGLSSLLTTAQHLERNCFQLGQRVTDEVERQGIVPGDELTIDGLAELLTKNIVVEVLLMPLTSLREVQEWAASQHR